MVKETILWSDFEKVDLRLGTIIKAEEFKEAKKPAYKLEIDFGNEVGILKSSAQITHHYLPENLVGIQIIGVVNFAPKQIGPFISECLVLGVYDVNQQVILLKPDNPSENGSRIG